MRKNLYDSDKLIIIMYTNEHRYQAMFVGKALSFSKDVCVPLPRYKHFHLFEHDMKPAMWNEWFMEDNNKWLDYGWRAHLDFAQKQGYLNTHRTDEVDVMLESKKNGVMAICVDRMNQSTLTEMALIFPRAKIVTLTKSRKLKIPFGFNLYCAVDPSSISPYDATWQHGMDMWVSNRQIAMKKITSQLGLSMVQSELWAFFNKAGEHLPGYKSSGHWGRYHTIRFTLVPEDMAMVKIIVDGIMLDQQKIKTETDFYYETVGSKPIIDFTIQQYNMSHATMFNIVHVKKFQINDQDMLGTFFPGPPGQVIGKYTQEQLTEKKEWDTLDCDGRWLVKTDGVLTF